VCKIFNFLLCGSCRGAHQIPQLVLTNYKHIYSASISCILLSTLNLRVFRRPSAELIHKSNVMQDMNLNTIQKWLKRWRIKAIESKSVHVTFTTRRETFPPVHINNVHLPQLEDVKYLGLHLDRRLTWSKHIFTKLKQLGMTLTKMHWLLERKSKLSTSNKLPIYKAILKPIWTYGIQLWGAASISNIEILERFQSKFCARL
jgi:hypothetical protein